LGEYLRALANIRRKPAYSAAQSGLVPADAANLGDLARYTLAFTLAPHLQTINYRGRF
jgi:hypothetical protein